MEAPTHEKGGQEGGGDTDEEDAVATNVLFWQANILLPFLPREPGRPAISLVGQALALPGSQA